MTKSLVPFSDSDQFRDHGWCTYPLKTLVKTTESSRCVLHLEFVQFRDSKGKARRRCRIGRMEHTSYKAGKGIRHLVKGYFKKTMSWSNETVYKLTAMRRISQVCDVPGFWLEEAYPLIRDFPFVQSRLIKHFKFDRLRDMCKHLTGSSGKGCSTALTNFLIRSNNDGFKSFCEGIPMFDDSRLDVIKKFGRRLGSNWSIELLNKLGRVDVSQPFLKTAIKHLERIAPLHKVVENAINGGHATLVDDIARFIVARPTAVVRASTVEEAHNNYVRILNREETDLVMFDNSKHKFEELNEGQIQIKLPQSNHELGDWGASQRHCVKSYAKMHEQGNHTIFGVFKDSKLVACGDIEEGVIVQLYGPCNTHVTCDIYSAVRAHLVQCDWKYWDSKYNRHLS